VDDLRIANEANGNLHINRRNLRLMLIIIFAHHGALSFAISPPVSFSFSLSLSLSLCFPRNW